LQIGTAAIGGCRHVKLYLYPDHICIRKKILYVPWAFYALIYELYDVGITHITTLRRSVELCSAGRFLHHPQNIFQKFSENRLFDGVAIVLLTERESSTYSPAERG